MISGMPAGARLPSIRGLMQRFKVSQVTIDRSLTLLETSGEVKRRPSVGYYRAVPSQKSSKKIMFCFCYRPQRISNPLYGSMLAEFLHRSEARDYKVGIMTFDETEGVKELQRKLEDGGMAYCIMLGSSRQTSSYLLKEMGMPFIQLYPNYMPEEGETIIIDNAAIMSQLVGLLADQGHERIAMLHGQNFDNRYMLDQEERMEAFYQEMANRGLQTTARSMVYGGFDTETGYAAAMKLLDTAAELRPTAIVANDYSAAGVYRAAAELGLRIPDDLSVTGIDNLPQCLGLSPLLTTIDIEWSTALDMAFDFIENEKRPGTLRRVPVQLVERKSVAACPVAIH